MTQGRVEGHKATPQRGRYGAGTRTWGGASKKQRVLAALKRIPSLGRGAEAALSLMEQLGLKHWIGAALMSLAIGIVAWFRDNVPWYIALLVALAVLALILWIYHRIQLIRATSKFDVRKYRQFGQQLVELSQEIFRFLADRARDQADMHRRNLPAEDVIGMRSRWQEDRDFDQTTGRIFFERFGPRVLGSLALLRRLGVSLPPHIVTTAQYQPQGLSQFMGTIGHLLSQGHIAQAIDVSRDRDFIWQIEH